MVVVEPQADNALGPGKDFSRIESTLQISFHPPHIAMAALGDPPQVVLALERRSDQGDPADIKAKRAGLFQEGALKLVSMIN